MKKDKHINDKHILVCFIENPIPSYIKEQSVGNWDLMECYEELFNYSHCILSGNEIDININSLGTGDSFVFNQEYKLILYNLAESTEDIGLEIHCYLSLATLAVLQKYPKKA